MAQRKARRKSERRVATRADARLSMRVEGAPQEGALTQIVTESQNISASGVYCSSPHYLAPLSKVALTIVLPGKAQRNGTQRLLKCEGIVVRCLAPERAARDRQYELACSFLGLEDEYRHALDEFVSWRNIQALRAPKSKLGRTVANGRSRTSTVAKRRPATRTTTRKTGRPASRAVAGRDSASRSSGTAARPSATRRSTARARTASRARTSTRGRRSLS